MIRSAAFVAVLTCSLATSTARAAAPSLPPSPKQHARVAVIIGYNGGAPDPRAPLSFADDDAARLYETMAPSTVKSYLLTTFDHASALVFPELTDVARPPSKEALAQVLAEAYWILRQNKAEGKDTELVFAFAGHGDVDDAGEGFVVLADGAFTRSDLEAQITAGSPADENHIIIDACASYFMVSPRGGAAQSGQKQLTPAMLDVLRGPTHVDAAARARTGVFVSTSSAAEVDESAELESGVFSFLLRSALAGAADSNGDGIVEYAEAAAFVSSASSALDDPRAQLAIHAEPPLQRPHAALASLRDSGARAFLAVDTSGPVHIRINDAHGAPYAELSLPAGARPRPILLALVGNPFFFVDEGSREALLVPRSAGAYALSALTFSEREQARGSTSTDARFRGLFAHSYDEEYLRGFVSSAHMVPPASEAAPFAVDYAAVGAPPARIPVDTIGLATLGTAAALAAVAAACVVGNLAAFADLQSDFAKRKVIDEDKAFAVEGWRTAATATAVGAAALGVTGASLYLWSLSLDDGILVGARRQEDAR